MSKFSKNLLESLQQAVDYSKGKNVPGMRVAVRPLGNDHANHFPALRLSEVMKVSEDWE